MNNESIKKSGFIRSQATNTSLDVLNNQGRIPPQAVDLEEVVLGALMLEKFFVREDTFINILQRKIAFCILVTKIRLLENVF